MTAPQGVPLRSSDRPDGLRVLLVVALAVTGFSMRTAVTSVGSVLDDLQSGLHTSSVGAGVLTTLPVVCFAVIGGVTPRWTHRFGGHRLLVVALAMMTVGLLARAMSGTLWLFLLLSVLALSGGAVANVLMPTLVKRHFPDRVGRMTALYATALAVGTTAAAGLTVPIGDLGDGWRTGVGSWALFSAVAVLPWLSTLAGDRPDPDARRGLHAPALVRSPVAWTLTVFFAAQSMQAYVAFGWFAKFMNAHGVGSTTAGAMVAVLSAVAIPVSFVAPSIPPARHRAVVCVLCGLYVLAYIGLGVAPVGGAWVWMVLAGAGSGLFPLSLAMIGLRSRTADTTAALSAFVQVIGYLAAGTGPLLFGVLHGVTGGWSWSFGLLYAALALALVSGWRAASAGYVDDDLAASN